MVSVKQSPINRTYLIAISTPEAVELAVRKLAGVLEQNGMTSSPLPGLIPVLEISSPPGPPVPGLLPACRAPLKLVENLEIDAKSGWIYWPVNAGGWLNELSAGLGDRENERMLHESGILPLRLGIALARWDKRGMESILSSPEVSKILENPPGWRALNLCCWSVESISGRPWEQSVSWYPLWQRRLSRAPKLTNNNK